MNVYDIKKETWTAFTIVLTDSVLKSSLPIDIFERNYINEKYGVLFLEKVFVNI